MPVLTGLLAFVTLFILPGCWITFGLRGSDLPFWTRLWLGVAVSPVVVLAEFDVLRLLAVPFGTTCLLMAAVNALAAWPVLRYARGVERLTRDVLPSVVAVAVVATAVMFLHFGPRAFTGHAWMHADVVYQLANGGLRPEEPMLAGLRLAYPWFGHVQQAALSYVTGTPPAFGYFWTNLLVLGVTLALTWTIVTLLGGGPWARVWSLILVLFGVNFFGYFGRAYVSHAIVNPNVFGDTRFTPWIRKFFFFSQQPAAEAMFAGLLLILADRLRDQLSRYRLVLASILLAALGAFYPILFPAGEAVVGARGLIVLVRPDSPRGKLRHLLELTVVAVIGALATAATVRWITMDRGPAHAVELADWYQVRLKIASCFVALLPMIPGAWLALRRSTSEEAPARILLALTALACVALNVVFYLPGFYNEYKFVFPAAQAFAILAAIGMGPHVARLRRLAMPATVFALLVLAFPAVHRWATAGGVAEDNGPGVLPVDGSTFNLRLDPGKRYAGATDALRLTTPVNAVVVVADPGLHLPTIVQRSLYAPYVNAIYAGIGVREDFLLHTVKGYPDTIVTARRQTLHDFFEPATPEARVAALQRIESLRRPIAFLVDDLASPGLSRWLAGTQPVTREYEGNELSVWLWTPAPGAAHGRG